MNESIIAVRYTKALFNLAKEKNLLEQIKADVEAMYVLIDQSDDLKLFIENPVIQPSKKSLIFKQVFQSFNPITLSFIDLLVKKKREEYLIDICRDFVSQYKKYRKIETAVFTTAVAVDAKVLEKVKELIKSGLKTDVELTGEVKSSLIGGFVLRVGDMQYDASVQTNLTKIKRRLTNSSI